MDDLRCWIVIPWAQYRPPEIPERGIGKATGQLCLGHLIPDIEHLDKIINRREGPTSYPVDMPAVRIRSYNFKHDWSNMRARSANFQGSAPVAKAAGIITAKANAAVAFQRTVHNWWEYDSVDFLTIMPTREYIEDSIASKDDNSLKLDTRLGSSWTIYMISGLVIAQSGTTGAERERSQTLNIGLGAGLVNVVDSDFNANRGDERNFSTSRRTTESHIFALRLTKVFKKAHKRDWDYETLFYKDESTGGVFLAGDNAAEKRQLRQVLPTIAGLSDAQAIGLEEDNEDNDVFLIPATIVCSGLEVRIAS